MSRENVELVRELLAEFFTTQKAVRRLITPDMVWDMGTFRGWPEAPTYVGPDGFGEFFAKWVEPYAAWDLSIPDLRDLGDDRVLAILTQRGRPRGASSWVELFASDEEALEAMGLRE